MAKKTENYYHHLSESIVAIETISEKYHYFVLVDANDFLRINYRRISVYLKWSKTNLQKTPYAHIMLGDGLGRMPLHDFIVGDKKKLGLLVDHINSDTLDERKLNLRCCTVQQNGFNSKKPSCKTSSIYKGVYLNKGKWQAMIMVDRKYNYIGRFENEKEAAIAYNEAAKRLHGDYAQLNIVP